MIEKISLRIFWAAAFACAIVLLAALWLSEGEPNEWLMRTAFTFFVIGCAAFVVWVPLLVYRFYEKM